jgi:hypothetical protein
MAEEEIIFMKAHWKRIGFSVWKIRYMKHLLLITMIASLLFSTVLLVKEYNTVERWQERGLSIYDQKMGDFKNWKTNIHPGNPQKWLTDNPAFIALKTWIEMLSNMASLFIALSSLGLYTKLKRLTTARKT